VILSAIFTTALNDQITFLHPCKGVKTPPVPLKPHTIITPEQFSAVYERCRVHGGGSWSTTEYAEGPVRLGPSDQ
jgi:hypothetical protein